MIGMDYNHEVCPFFSVLIVFLSFHFEYVIMFKGDSVLIYCLERFATIMFCLR